MPYLDCPWRLPALRREWWSRDDACIHDQNLSTHGRSEVSDILGLAPNLNTRLLVLRDHHSIRRRIEVQAHNVRRLRGKLRISADYTRSAVSEDESRGDATLSKSGGENISQPLGQQFARPRGMTGGGSSSSMRTKSVSPCSHRKPVWLRAGGVPQTVQANRCKPSPHLLTVAGRTSSSRAIRFVP